jgi:phosphopantothenoylcysteine decarboxylase / phosphopantothenate---cysteine ligase
MMTLAHKHIILGLSGSIACYQSALLTRLFRQAGASVQIVMTEAATHFITPVTMQALSGHSVYTSQWDPRVANNMAHITLSRAADVILVAPASADFIAKLACGQADDLLSALALARECPLLIAPAMNQKMWQHPATQRNIAQLNADGVIVLGPANGPQACGEEGDGRMLAPDALLDAIVAFSQPKCLQGKRVLLTAGPTFEPIDPIRGITNRSSGKMGFALARAAAEAGARVQLVAGPTALATPEEVQREDVQTAQQMYEAVMAHVLDTDIFIAVAAVSDWCVEQYSPEKIKKNRTAFAPHFTFVKTPDILTAVTQLPKPPYCVGFAAESSELEKHGREKRAYKKVPLLVGNIGPETFDCDKCTLTLFDEHGCTPWPRANKQVLARQLIAEIARRWTDYSSEN